MNNKEIIERQIVKLDNCIQRWARKFSSERSEPYEDIVQEIRVVLWEKGLRKPKIFSDDKDVGYFYVLIKNHFTDQDRRKQSEIKHSESFDPTSIEFETLAVTQTWLENDEELTSNIVHSAMIADPGLVVALLDSENYHSTGNVNHTKVASMLGEKHTNYYRRLDRLRQRLGLASSQAKDDYQLAFDLQ